ncbi:MAG TPA: glycerol-3-phosphate 1-O-acyltransferase PlsY [Bacillota bacterium]|nr:glycerol-3-phosphate 1-O-acyltransferase PlsY [Bacillota bacterium]
MTLSPVILLSISYVIGSIPFGLLLGTSLVGVDVRKHGSGNIGATNVLRTLGFPFGFVTFLLDASKGLAVVLLGRALGANDWVIAASGLAVVAGHNWSIFLGFRGGKGIATTFGFIFAIMPPVGLILAAVWLGLVCAFRYASLGSMVGVAATPIAAYFMGYPSAYVIVCAILAVLAVVRHRSNIERLLSGTENKFALRAK